MKQRLAPVLFVAALFAPACDNKPPTPEQLEEEKEAAVAATMKVSLPGTPNFDDGKAPESYPDGAQSIYGLRKEVDANVEAGDKGTEVTVRVWVQDVYVPPPCPEGEACPPGKQPHAWVTDHQGEKGRKRAMMVVNYAFNIPDYDEKRWKKEPLVVLEAGKQYTIRGKFKRFSDTGFSHDKGVLEFVAYRPLDPATGAEQQVWIMPPGAPWHPIEVAKAEESAATLADRAAASKVKQ